ncbi:MAG TPA: hypothetical protein VFJ12_04300 [Segeticoccus sp.]|nr:hypothetical protein [Segeticoccus sp.]
MGGGTGAGDAEQVRALARAVARLAEELRAARDRAVTAGQVDWVSAAASGYRTRLREEVSGLTGLAGELDSAARLLLAHAAAVEADPR